VGGRFLDSGTATGERRKGAATPLVLSCLLSCYLHVYAIRIPAGGADAPRYGLWRAGATSTPRSVLCTPRGALTSSPGAGCVGVGVGAVLGRGAAGPVSRIGCCPRASRESRFPTGFQVQLPLPVLPMPLLLLPSPISHHLALALEGRDALCRGTALPSLLPVASGVGCIGLALGPQTAHHLPHLPHTPPLPHAALTHTPSHALSRTPTPSHTPSHALIHPHYSHTTHAPLALPHSLPRSPRTPSLSHPATPDPTLPPNWT
jgi:hypothetical protein